MCSVAIPSSTASFVRTPCLAVMSQYVHTFFSAIRPLRLSNESSASQLSGAILFNLLIAAVTHCSSTEVLGSSSELLDTTRMACAASTDWQGFGWLTSLIIYAMPNRGRHSGDLSWDDPSSSSNPTFRYMVLQRVYRPKSFPTNTCVDHRTQETVPDWKRSGNPLFRADCRRLHNLVGKTVHNVGGLACILGGPTNSHNQSP